MRESEVGAQTRLAVTKECKNVRLFRNNVGAAWQGKVVWSGKAEGSNLFRAVIEPAQRVEYGLFDGSGDYIGWRSLVITPEMVGKTIGQFVSWEAKRTGKDVKKDSPQDTWRQNVCRAGGLGFAADETAKAIAILRSAI
jgi:hypothetical protein